MNKDSIIGWGGRASQGGLPSERVGEEMAGGVVIGAGGGGGRKGTATTMGPAAARWE